jgi:hypothetical protein
LIVRRQLSYRFNTVLLRMEILTCGHSSFSV